MSTHGYDVLLRLASLAKGTRVSVAINCHLDRQANTLRGWYCRLPPATPATLVPFPPSMFDGVTVVETRTCETRVLELLRDREHTLRALARAAERYSAVGGGKRASWHRCRPHENVPLQNTRAWNPTIRADVLSRYATVCDSGERVSIASDAPIDFVPDETIPNYIDQATWEPELSAGGFVGLYHQWYPLRNGKRELKLYLACQSHCELAGMDVKQIVNDLGPRVDVRQVARSEEAWWLCNVNARNRRRLLFHVARELGLDVQSTVDTHAATECEMVVPTAETLCDNIYQYQDGSCGIASACVPTSFVSNGIVCKMSPWEGLGLYHGAHSSSAACQLGTAFGDDMAVFPTGTVPLNHEDEAVARAARLVVHRPANMCSEFWVDSSEGTQCVEEGPSGAEAGGPGARGGGGRGGGGGEEDASAYAAGFAGVDEADFYEAALDVWTKARQAGMYEQAPSGGGGGESGGGAGLAPGRQSFVSFGDHLVVSRLMACGWEPQNGFVQLLPLAVYTHQFDGPRL